MENLFLLLLLISLFLLIIGFFSPKTSLFWYKKERTRKVSLLFYGLGTIIFFALFGITAPDINTVKEKLDEANQQDTISSQQKDSIAAVKEHNEIAERKKVTFTASQLVEYYKQNEVSADNNFKDKTFYVVGYIDAIGKNISGDTYVTLRSGDLIRRVQCFIDDQEVLANLQKGQKITVYGTGGGLMMNVLMQSCTIVDNL